MKIIKTVLRDYDFQRRVFVVTPITLRGGVIVDWGKQIVIPDLQRPKREYAPRYLYKKMWDAKYRNKRKRQNEN